ncbi:hypothetical protein NP493_199g03023 [Ridgeia piscesae]|uniref:FAD-binding oxidoreductase/transferase type 4 C-terminal domain-containing protein n=1 Tax=Ridgeia piscesae TaxID=27915 RepID=A0AAD9P1U4_RIDPI|nr:hypothetical protein NP493_199g03023 [Ridgeia piscesae]
MFLAAGYIVGHVGDGNFHALIAINNEKELHEVKHLADDMAQYALDVGGTCTGEHGIGLGKRHLLEKELGEVGIDVMKQLKRALDPKNIMNPGKVLVGV